MVLDSLNILISGYQQVTESRRNEGAIALELGKSTLTYLHIALIDATFKAMVSSMGLFSSGS